MSKLLQYYIWCGSIIIVVIIVVVVVIIVVMMMMMTIRMVDFAPFLVDLTTQKCGLNDFCVDWTTFCLGYSTAGIF